jgi:hypothetical protein
MFADDTSILVTANTKDVLTERLNFILILISKWFQAKRFIFNPIRTKVLKFEPTKLSSALNSTYAGQFIPELETMKFLGLQLVNQISWKYHLSFLQNKLSSACFIMK